MRYLIDTNILVSAALWPHSVPAQAFMKAIATLGDAVVCDYSMDEMRRVFNEKFPHRIAEYESFVSRMALSVEVVFTPTDENQHESEDRIRDVKDRSILRAAIAAGVDAIITGDNDFLETDLEKPKTITAMQFLETK
jgi:putative PIN family toxin of toxin-antitoxin system